MADIDFCGDKIGAFWSSALTSSISTIRDCSIAACWAMLGHANLSTAPDSTSSQGQACARQVAAGRNSTGACGVTGPRLAAIGGGTKPTPRCAQPGFDGQGRAGDRLAL